MKHTAFAAFLGVMLQVTAAFAQGQGGGSPVYQNWFPVGTPATLSVSNVTANVALPTGGLTARVCNTGATDAYVVLGTANTVVATTTAGSFLASGKCQPFNLLPFATRYTYIAAITASSTTTIRVESGLGSPIASDAAGASAPPSGPAGGDLAGTYPNPTVAKASSGFALPSSALTFSGNITGAAIFGTNGIKVKTTSGTLSDTTSSGTVAANYNNLFGGNTQTATSATTITNNYGSYFTLPTCSTNVTCTANWALGADSANIGGTAITLTGAINMAAGQTLTTQYISATTQIQLGGTNQLFWTGRSSVTSPADGTVRLTNSGQTSFGVLQLYSDTGLSRDSVLGALNLDLGNGSANDKSGTLNAAKVALGGATIGTDALGITGTMTISGLGTFNSGLLAPQINIGSTGTGNVAVSSTGAYGWTASASSTAAYDLLLTRAGAASLRLGAADAAAPVAQTLGIQNVVAGTSNTAGPQFTIRTGTGTGTGIGGNTVFQYAPHDVVHTVNTFTGSASPYTIGFTAGNITTYPIGTVMTVSGCTTATLNGTYTVTASSSGSVTATTSATGTGSPTTCQIVGNTSQNAWATALTINGDTAAITAVGSVTATTLQASVQVVAPASGPFVWSARSQMLSPSDGVITFANQGGSAFTALQLGGSTASFPEIKRSTTAINFRLADDSADAPITAAAITNSGSLIAGGSAPTPTGTCTRGTQNGGNTTGSIVLTCTAQTLILTFATTAPTGYMCEAIDQTTTADTMKQTSNTTTSCTLTGTTAASDVVLFQARAY